MARYLLRPFQDRPTGRTAYAMHEITAGSPSTSWTTKPEAVGMLTPLMGRSGYLFRFGDEDGQEVESVGIFGLGMDRRGHDVFIAR